MLGIGELIASKAIGQAVRTIVKDILSKLGFEVGNNNEDDQEERKELIHALARAQREQTEAREKVEDEREERESIENRLEQQKRVLDLMDRRGYDREMLVERYQDDNSLSVLLVAAADKDGDEEDEDGDKEENTYLKDLLNEEYDAEPVVGALKIIPPNQIPDSINSDDDVEPWIEDLVAEQPEDTPPSGIYFAARKDISEVYSAVDAEKFDNGWKTASEVVDEVLSVDDLQGLINSAPISPISLVQDGDLLFLAQDTLPPTEIDAINEHQQEIASDLDDPNLRTLAKDISQDTMIDALEDTVETPEQTAESLLTEAQEIHNQLSRSDTISTVE